MCTYHRECSQYNISQHEDVCWHALHPNWKAPDFMAISFLASRDWPHGANARPPAGPGMGFWTRPVSCGSASAFAPCASAGALTLRPPSPPPLWCTGSDHLAHPDDSVSRGAAPHSALLLPLAAQEGLPGGHTNTA